MRLRFGEVTFDPDAMLLLRGPEAVHLAPRSADLLALLLRERPRPMSKEELLGSLWPGTTVTESNLASLVTDVRTAVGDHAKPPAFIRAHDGSSYAFSGAVVTEAPARPGTGAKCALVWGMNVTYLSAGENVLGRDPDAPVWIGDPSVSRRHARILVEGEDAVLEDLGSKNGTYFGDRRIEGRVPIHDGDELLVGSVTLVFRTEA